MSTSAPGSLIQVGHLQIPSTLPQAVDPQIRNFFAQLQLQLRGWSDEVTRDINLLIARGPLSNTSPQQNAIAFKWNGTKVEVWVDTTLVGTIG